MKLSRRLVYCSTLLLAFTSCKGQTNGAAVEESPVEVIDTVSIFVVGDIMCHGAQARSAFEVYSSKHPGASREDHYAYDWSCSFKGVEDDIRNADIAIGNMEFPFGGPPFKGYPVFSAPDSYIDYVRDIGFDVLLAANNHILDMGKPGIDRTITVYDKMESESAVQYTGISADAEADESHYPVYVRAHGLKIAIVNFTYGTNTAISSLWPKVNREKREDIAKAMERAKAAEADYILVLPHWGIEYERNHNRAQANLADWLISKGADAIVGAHPHRVQDMELREVTDPVDSTSKLVPIFYSLGNAVSNQNDPEGRLELMVTLRIVKSSLTGESRMIEPLWKYVWCTKPGMILQGYDVVPVKEYLDKPDAWVKQKDDYGVMKATYEKVKKNTRIED